MNQRLSIKHLVLLGILVMLYGLCMAQKSQEMPITTSSMEALDLFKKGRDLFESFRLSEATSYFEKAIAKDSTFAMAYQYYAFLQSSMDKSRAYLKRSLKSIGKVSEGERNLLLATEADFLLFDEKKARGFYEKLVQLYPHDKRARFELGNHCFRNRHYDVALSQFNKVIELDPRFAEAYNALGYIHLRTGRYDQAETALKTYAELLPYAANPHDSYAEVLMKQGKFDESLAEYRKALSIDPKFYMAYFGIGDNLIFQGKGDEAREEFWKFYDVSPDDGFRRMALRAVSHSYIFEGNYNKAMEEIRKSYALAEKSRNYTDMASDVSVMAAILFEMGKLDESRSKNLEVLKLIERSDIATDQQKEAARQTLRYSEVEIALKEGDIATARNKAAEHKLKANAGKDQWELRASHALEGMIALYEKKYDDALNELQQADLRNPRNLCRIAEAYEGKGDMAKAREYWSKAAHFNESMDFNYAFVRSMALNKLTGM